LTDARSSQLGRASAIAPQAVPILIQVSGTGPSGRKFVNPADNPK
jgi:hypothetical protein